MPQIVWIAPDKDHYALQTADRFEGIEVFQNGSLIIHKVNSSDSGAYICVATANKKSVEATMHLTVNAATDPPSSTPKYIDAKVAH